MNIKDLAPGSYKVISGQVPSTQSAQTNPVGDFFMGVGKGGLSTLQNTGSLINKGLNATVGRAVDAISGKPYTPTDYSISPKLSGAQVNQALQPKNTAESAGFGSEKVAEFFLPAAKAAAAENIVKTLASGISNPLVRGAATVAGKSLVQGTAAGGVTLAQTGNPSEALKTGLTASAFTGPLAAAGETARGLKIPEWLYQTVFKSTLADMKQEINTTFLTNLAQKDPATFRAYQDAGIIKTAIGNKPILNLTTAENALARGLKGSVRNMANIVTGAKYKSEYLVQQLANSSKAKVDLSEMQFHNILSEVAADYKDVGLGELSTQAKALADDIFNSEGKVSVKTALDIRRLLDKLRYARSFDTPNTKLSLSQANLKQLSDIARKRLNAVPGMKPLMEEYSFNIEALEALAKEARSRGNKQLFSLLDTVLLGPGLATGMGPVGLGAVALRRTLGSAPGATNLAQGIKKGLGAFGAGTIGATSNAINSAENQTQ